MGDDLPRPVGAVLCACVIALAARAGWAASAPAAELSAAQIVAKNVAARGGLEAWRKVNSMVWMGHLERLNAPAPSMSFVLELKRPNKTRFEINAMRQTTTRIFDGVQGWKTRPGPRNGHNLTAYTPEELKFARDAQTIDGPLIDYEAKGSAVTLQGVEQLEGRKAYHLKVQFVSGERQDVWVDARSFLDLRVDRMAPFNPRGPNDAAATVPVYLRNYKTIEGLQIPTTLEIGVGRGGTPDKMEIERIAVNPPLADRLFANPESARGRHAAVGAGAEQAGDRMSMPK
jgi:hypothetical protein